MAFAAAPAVVAVALVSLKLFSASPVVAAVEPVKVAAPALRHAREAVEVRPATGAPLLRKISLRGQGVELGQGTLEGSGTDGAAHPFLLAHTSVDAEVLGFVSTVTVTQEFENPFKEPVEGVYVFPLPDNAAVDQMTLTAGSRVIRATIQKREAARRMYEEAKSQGRRAALLDQERPNIFTQSVANLLPGEKVKVTLRYSAALTYDDGEYTFNFPMVVGPRYIPGDRLAGQQQGTGVSPDTTRVLDASRISPPAERTGRDIDVTVRLDAGNAVERLYSTSHRLFAERESAQKLVVTLDPTDRIPNKDLILHWRVAGPTQRATMLASGGTGGTFALMVVPPAPDVKAEVIPREMVFVIDTSCSMSGPPLAASKKAMRLALTQMGPHDTFMLIDFASTASSFHDSPLPNTPGNVERALSYLDALPAGGGTNQLVGLEKALDRPGDSGRLRTVLLMTDGYIGNEQEIFGRVQQILGHARLFGFGIGTSVNHYFLERLSELGRGYAQTIRPDQDAGPVIDGFVKRLSRPLLTDIEIDWGSLGVSEVLPSRIPDLFDAQPLVVIGRYKEPRKGTIIVRGDVNGRRTQIAVDVDFPATQAGGGPGLKAIWARAKIEGLERQQYGLERSEVIQQITTLGLEYHLVTAYTSLVAIEETPVTAARDPKTVVVPTDVPELTENADGRFANGTASGNKHGAAKLGGDLGGGAKGGGSAPVGGLLGGFDTMDRKPVKNFGGESDGDEFASAFGSSGVGRGGGGNSDPGTVRYHEGGRGPAQPQADEGKFGKKDFYIPPPAAGHAAEVQPSLTTSAIMETVLAHKAELAKCVEEQHRRQPGLTGKLILRWTVTPDGKVVKVELVTTEFAQTYVAVCLMNQVKTWVFPKHVLQSSPITFPFKF